MTMEAGTKLGRYEIRSKLGAGGMSQLRFCLPVSLQTLIAASI
jgi:hypothetical protein